MTPFARALTAFKQAQLGYEELLQLTRGLSAHSDSDIASALTSLESEYRSGGLPQAVYIALQQELSDKTVIAAAQNEPDDKTMIASPKDDDATVVAGQPGQQCDTPTQVQPSASPTQYNTTLNTESLLQGLDDSHPYKELTVGNTLKNRFVLQELIGKGGMGMVFKATDLRKIEAADKEPFVALKVLSQDFKANPMALVALQRETKRAQTLSHPHIINVYDFDRDGQ
ncbi:MAG: serine/threonine protein kinase, partial [Methylomonas sp.]|nr:serine/threonine protein kinase [Methylomonas sp.]